VVAIRFRGPNLEAELYWQPLSLSSSDMVKTSKTFHIEVDFLLENILILLGINFVVFSHAKKLVTLFVTAVRLGGGRKLL
jgi:hypothetical protein